MLLMSPLEVKANVRSCEIRYGETGLDNDVSSMNFVRGVSNQLLKTCHRIGVEHHENGEPILNKPIYACCRYLNGPGEKLD